MSCISIISLAILLNGVATPFFRSGRGLKQGCPLSPLLFILIIEGLSWLHKEEEGFGRGRGPMVCHNCQQLGHYAGECRLPPATCMYCGASDHDTEECLTLLVKIYEKRNQNNQNVQWISAEARDEGHNVNIVMRRGAKTRNDAARQELVQHQWIKKNVEPRRQFDTQNKIETFKQARQEFLKQDTASTSTMQ
jgi:hypothetical protein